MTAADCTSSDLISDGFWDELYCEFWLQNYTNWFFSCFIDAESLKYQRSKFATYNQQADFIGSLHKGKGLRVTCSAGAKGGAEVWLCVSLTSVLGAAGWSTTRPGALPPGKNTVTHFTRNYWSPGSLDGWGEEEVSSFHRVRTPNCPRSSE